MQKKITKLIYKNPWIIAGIVLAISIFELLSITYGIGLPILDEATAKLVENLSYSLFASAVFYLLIITLPNWSREATRRELLAASLYKLLHIGGSGIIRLLGVNERSTNPDDIDNISERMHKNGYKEVSERFELLKSEVLTSTIPAILELEDILSNHAAELLYEFRDYLVSPELYFPSHDIGYPFQISAFIRLILQICDETETFIRKHHRSGDGRIINIETIKRCLRGVE